MIDDQDLDILWEGDFITVVSPKDNPYEAVHEQDIVHVVALDVATQTLYIREELCPPYTVKDQDNYDRFYTVISGGIEEGETPQEAALREVEEEIGITFKSEDDFQLVPLTPEAIPYIKLVTQRVSVYALLMYEFDKKEPEGDGTHYEELSTFVEVDFSDIDKYLETTQCDYLLHAAISKLKYHLIKSIS